MNVAPFLFPLDELHHRIMAFVASDSLTAVIEVDGAFQSNLQGIVSYYAIQLGDDFTVYMDESKICIRRNQSLER